MTSEYRLSPAAEARCAALLAKPEGEATWSDLFGILEPDHDYYRSINKCPSEDISSGAECDKGYGHEGTHSARIEW